MTIDHIPDRIIKQLDQQTILILGLGKEGKSSYQFLRSVFPEKKLGLADQSSLSELDADWQQLLAEDNNTVLHLGKNYLTHLDQYQLVVKTPGIPPSLPQIRQAQADGVEFSSNLQLAMEIVYAWRENLNENFQNSIDLDNHLPAPIIIGVTGTKGKSTTTSVIDHVLDYAGLNSQLMGNIGTPALSQLDKVEPKSVLVIEMSSHQLNQLSLSPDIAVIQRITSEHLDYYQSTADYVASKEAITKYQTPDQYVIVHPDWKKSKQIADLSPGRQLYFSLSIEPEKPTAGPSNGIKNDALVYIKSNKLTFNHSGQEQPIVAVDRIPLLGRHNLFNLMPAVIIGKMLGAASEKIAQALASFEPLPHRLEFVAEKNGVSYYNDSMATMPDAAVSALDTFAEQAVILIAGGHERNQDFGPLAQKILDTNVKSLLLFSPTGPRIWDQVQTLLGDQAADNQQTQAQLTHQFVDSMPEAITAATELAESGDIVLLSPGSASFGVFKNYRDRGRQFRNCVKDLET